ncbi:Marine sediment metagenome DNA, contig: S01H1_S39905 (Fragment) OS=marine sediment metagenome GN=S01H1_80896 PE=4 SV=1 [Gemmataceae bacterium]
MPDTAPKPIAATPAPPKLSHSELVALVRKAEGGDAAALTEITKFLDIPGAADQLGGNVAQEALRLLIERHAGKNPVVRASVTRRVEQMRAELLGANPSTLERLLVSRVVSTWLHLHHLEAQYAGRESLSLPLAGHYQKCITAAQKRYLAAIKGLADVRRLALPVLQVNIAKQQLNVAGAVAAG